MSKESINDISRSAITVMQYKNTWISQVTVMGIIIPVAFNEQEHPCPNV